MGAFAIMARTNKGHLPHIGWMVGSEKVRNGVER